MTIQFQCPNCRQPYKVRDDLAGKKVTCKECKKVVTVPAAAAVDHGVLEHLAVSALTDEPAPAPAADGAAGTVEVECPMCAETVQFPAAQAGKRAQCPSCRRIIQVPLPKADKPKDWRGIDVKKPTLARTDTEPAPEGAWGNTTGASVVSKEALVEAAVIRDRRREPAPLSVRLPRYLVLAAAVAACFGGAIYFLRHKAEGKRAQFIQLAEDSLNRDAKTLPPAFAAAAQRGIGEFYLGGAAPDVQAAAKHLRVARVALGQTDAGPDRVLDRARLATDLALTIADLPGDAAAVKAGTKLRWEDVQKDLRQTAELLGNVPRDAADLLIGELTRKLGTQGPGSPSVVALVNALYGDDPARGRAVVGLELLAGGHRDEAEALAGEARQAFASEGAGRAPVRLVALLVALKQAAQAQRLLPAPRPDAEPGAEARVAYAEGLARTGDPNDLQTARRIAAAPGAYEPRLIALVALADGSMAAHPGEGVVDVEAAVKFVEDELKGRTVSEWALTRLGMLVRRAGKPELGKRLAAALPKETVRAQTVVGWVQYDALLARLAGEKAKVEDDGLKDVAPDKGVTQALAGLALARFNVRFLNDAEVKAWIDAWPNPAARPLGYVGAALGLQDGAK